MRHRGLLAATVGTLLLATACSGTATGPGATRSSGTAAPNSSAAGGSASGAPRTGTSGTSGTSGTPATSGTSGTSTSGTSGTTGSTRPAWAGAVPLQPGQRPPQLIVLSFDGASWHDLMTHWLATAHDVHADVTFFLSGVYLVPADRAAQLYRPPGHPAGSSSIGFSTVPRIRVEIEDLRQAYTAGHEIGTHLNGHFCGSTGIDRWTAADFTSELDQFDGFLDNWAANTGITGVAPLPFTSAEVRGLRTPCLDGRTTPLLTAERQAGFRYDASRTGLLRWPTKLDGLWEFPLPSIRLSGTRRTVLAMDYNFYASQSGAAPAAAGARTALRQQVVASYEDAFQAVYQGNRAPLILGNHFNQWNGGIYTDALTDFVRAACIRPDVRCVSFADLADWLDAQDPATLTRLHALAPAQ